jgi:outer membrane protein assembly factor BamD (BamD/ComL family)
MIRNLTVPVFLALATAAAAADVIVAKHGTFTGEVVRVEKTGVILRLPIGEMQIQKADIVRVTVEKPASVAEGQAALSAGKYAEAVAALKPVVDRYAGLPVPWVRDAMLALGNAYTKLQDTDRAQAVLEKVAELYPDAVTGGATEIKLARVAVNQGKHAEALATARKFIEPLLKKDPLTDAERNNLAEALVVQGDCLRAAKEWPQALDSYLLVTTLFDENDALTAEAAFKAGQVFEDMNNTKRAKETYQELVRDYPNSPQAKKASQRLAALEQQ